MAEVPDDVSEAILSKLPIKSLLRFSCASKTWYSIIISDRQFCKMTMRPRVLICENLRDFSTVTVESLLTEDRATTPPLPCPWETPDPDDRYISCLGSCNGLICMDRRNDRRVDRSGLILCNPSTRKFKTLPRPRRYLEEDWWNYAWFGYDEAIDDYKIVSANFRDVRRRVHCRRVAELDVFTLKSNTWRSRAVDHIEVERGGDDDVVCTGGALCNNEIRWITVSRPIVLPHERPRYEWRFLALDLAKEECRLLEHSHPRLDHNTRIGSLDGERLWLCTHVYEREEYDGDYYNSGGFLVSNLWVMKEYGVESSWTKVLSIGQRYGYHNGIYFNDDDRPMRPILLSKEKEGNEMVVICNFSSKKSRRFVKLRFEEGKIKVKKKEDIVLGVTTNPCTSLIIVPMEESLVSIN